MKTLYTLKVYESKSGKLPFHDWLIALSDEKTRQIIRARLGRMELGNFGHCEPVGTGISELKIDFGPGYRIYFTLTGKTIVLLLCAGNKKTQSKDIKKAKEYFQDYKMRGPAHGKN